jgi:hypothetical protein
MQNTEKTIVCFHVGRGGRFHNQGHVFFLRHCTPEQMFNNAQEKNWLFDNPENWFEIKNQIGERPNLLEKWENNDQDFFQRKGFDLGENWYFDSNGNPIVSCEDVESGIFVLNFDNDYNTYYSKLLKDCTESELKLIVQEDCDHVEDSKKILIDYYLCYEFEEQEEINE